MYKRKINLFIFSFFVLVCSMSSVQAGDIGLTPWEKRCQSFTSHESCAQTMAQNLYKKYASVFSHTGEHLVVKLQSGRTKLIADATSSYSVVDYIENAHYLVVRQQYTEGNSWLILSLQSGLLTKVEGYPIFSPNYRYFFAWESHLLSAINPPIARIFRSSHPVPFPEWKSECEDILDWKLSDVNWSTDELLILQQGIASPQNVEVRKLKKMNAYGVRWSAPDLDCAAP